MEQTFAFRIRKEYNNLRNSEKKVADALLSEEFDPMNSSIEGLAALAGVSQPTIIRFARAFSMKGFRDIKKAMLETSIAKERKLQPSQVVSFALSPDDKLVDTPAKVITTHMKRMEDMLKHLSSYSLIRAIDALVSARTIAIFAVENSCCVADDLRTKLTYMGFPVVYHPDAYLQKVCACKLTPADVAIGISYTGMSKTTVDALAHAKHTGATTIAITNFEKNLISQHADMILSTGNEQYLYGNAIFSRCTQIALVDMLYTGILVTDYEKYARNIEENAQTIASFSYENL